MISKLVQDLLDERNADAAAEFKCLVTAAVSRRWEGLEDRLDKLKPEVSEQMKD